MRFETKRIAPGDGANVLVRRGFARIRAGAMKAFVSYRARNESRCFRRTGERTHALDGSRVNANRIALGIVLGQQKNAAAITELDYFDLRRPARGWIPS